MLRVACAVIFESDKVLVTQRGPSMSLPTKWEFPGGKMEAGETAETCVVREIMEELKIRIEPTGKLNEQVHDYGDFQITLIPVTARVISGKIELREHSDFCWLSPDEFTKIDWAAADLGVVAELLKKHQTNSK